MFIGLHITHFNTNNAEKVLYKALIANGGNLNLNDKSTPEDITNQLSMSKNVFKKAVGALYKQKRLEITKTGIKLIEGKEEYESE